MREGFYYNDWLCDECGATFIPRNVIHRYCSQKCASHAAYERRKAKLEAQATSAVSNGERA